MTKIRVLEPGPRTRRKGDRWWSRRHRRRGFTVDEVARAYDLPVIMLGYKPGRAARAWRLFRAWLRR